MKMALIKGVLDSLYRRLDAGDENKDEVITASLVELSDSYWQPGGAIDYSKPSTRLGYVFRYVAAHADYLVQILRDARDERGEALFDGPTAVVTALGGGPGTDAVAIWQYLQEPRRDPPVIRVEFHVMDGEITWERTWSTMAEALGSQFAPQFHEIDATSALDRNAARVIAASDMLTVSYLLSELVQINRAGALSYLRECLIAAKAGAYIVYIDRSGNHTDAFDELCASLGLEIVVSSGADEHDARVHHSEDTSVLAEYSAKFKHQRIRLKAKNNYRVLRKV